MYSQLSQDHRMFRTSKNRSVSSQKQRRNSFIISIQGEEWLVTFDSAQALFPIDVELKLLTGRQFWKSNPLRGNTITYGCHVDMSVMTQSPVKCNAFYNAVNKCVIRFSYNESLLWPQNFLWMTLQDEIRKNSMV